jgi:uncharacterized protein DUF6941
MIQLPRVLKVERARGGQVMQLVYAFFADAADVGLTGKISLVGGDFETIFVSQVPTLHPQFALVARLLVSPEECEKSHAAHLYYVAPNGTTTMPVVTFQFTPHIVPGREGQPVRYFLVTNLALVVFLELGEHVFHLVVDDKDLGTIPIRVEQGPGPTATSSDSGHRSDR